MRCPAAAPLPGGEEPRPNAALRPGLHLVPTSAAEATGRCPQPARAHGQGEAVTHAPSRAWPPTDFCPRATTERHRSRRFPVSAAAPVPKVAIPSAPAAAAPPSPPRLPRAQVRSRGRDRRTAPEALPPPRRPGTAPPGHGREAPSGTPSRGAAGGGGRAEGKGSTCPRPYSLRVARGPGQAPRLLAEDEDGAGDVVGGALDLVRGQSQELGSPVGEAQRQVRAAAVLGARAASHDAAHEIGHGGLHPREHSTAAAQRGERRTGGGPAALPQWGPGRAGPGRAGSAGAGPRAHCGSGRSPPPGAAPAELSPAAAAESCDSAAGCARALPAPPAAPAGSERTPGTGRPHPPPARLPRRGRPAAGARRAGPLRCLRRRRPEAGRDGRAVTCGLRT